MQIPKLTAEKGWNVTAKAVEAKDILGTRILGATDKWRERLNTPLKRVFLGTTSLATASQFTIIGMALTGGSPIGGAVGAVLGGAVGARIGVSHVDRMQVGRGTITNGLGQRPAATKAENSTSSSVVVTEIENELGHVGNVFQKLVRKPSFSKGTVMGR
jgi:hypothetical protein